MGTVARQKERQRTGSHICWSAGGSNWGPQRLLAGSDGWQGLAGERERGVWGGWVDWGRPSSCSSNIFVVVDNILQR